MAEAPSPIEPKGLGRLIHIAGSGFDGTNIYVKHPENYKLDQKPIEQFQIYGKQSIQDTGLTSGRLHSLIYEKKAPYYRTTLTQTPDDGGDFVWKTVGAVSFIDSNGEKITIPRNELTLRKPGTAGTTDAGEDISTPVREQPPKAPTPLPAPDTTPSNIDEMGQIHRTPKPRKGPKVTREPDETKTQAALTGKKQPENTATASVTSPTAPESTATTTATPSQDTENAPPPSRDAALHEDVDVEETPAVTVTPSAPAEAPPAETLPTEARAPAESTTAEIAPSSSESVSPPLPPAVTELERRATELPKSISLIALDVDQMIQERAAKDMQVVAAETKGLIGRIWKGNIAQELIEQHAYQFRKKQVEVAHSMLTDETFRAIESRAKAKYEQSMRQKSGFGRAWTKFRDAVARNVGGYTTQEHFALAETGEMYANNELSNITEYESSLTAVRARYEKDFLDMDGVIRKNLGEHLTILTSGDPRHQAIVTGIKDIVHRYVTGEYVDKRHLESAMSEFAKAQKLGTGSNDFREAQLYASSLFRIAESAKTRVESGIALTAIDAELDAMEVRVGRAQMGEATQFQASSTEKVVKWLASQNIVGTLIANEATAGTITAAALTLGYLPRLMASKVAHVFGGALGGGAVAGTIAGLKENARMKREYFTFLRERESGGGLPQAGDKRREWMAAREIPQTDVTTLINRLIETAYDQHGLKADLSGEDLNKTLAYLADAKARRAISARGGENISLIRWGAAVDVGRANLDLSIDKLERDLLSRFGTTPDAQFGGQSITEFTRTLTSAQSQILKEGRARFDALNDPVKAVLGEISDNAPAVKVFRRSFLGIYGKATEKGSAEGLDKALREVKTAIRLEAVRRGVTTGAIGTAIGTALSEVVHMSDQILDGSVITNASLTLPEHIPTHAIEVDGIPHFTDLQGIDHAVVAQIPEHTNLVADATSQTYSLMDDHGTALIHGIDIDQSGMITNADALNATQEAAAHGLHFSNLAGLESAAGSTGEPVLEGGFDISAGEMAGGRGEWDWITQNMNEGNISSVEPATNVTAKLFHFYETNVVHNENVDIAQIPDYHRVVHYITDDQGIQTIDYRQMPDNMWFHNLPDVFRPEHQVEIGETMDRAMELHNKLMEGTAMDGANAPGWREIFDKMEASGDPDAHLYALMYKVGVADRPLTEAEFTELMQLLGGGGTPSGELLTHTGIIEQTTPGAFSAAGAIDLLPTPAVVPLPRTGMKPSQPGVVPEFGSFPQDRSDIINTYYGYYGSESDIGLIPRDTYKARFDRKIVENPDLDLSTDDSAVIQRYFERQTDAYKQELQLLTEGKAPLSPDTKVVITVPAYHEGKSIKHTLEQYAKQENPDQYELVIFENHPKDQPRDNTLSEIELFRQEHPDIHVTHLYKAFDEKVPIGKIRKYLVDSVLLRKQQAGITTPLIIVSNDADLIDINPKYATNLAKAFSANHELDAVGAKWDFPMEAYRQMPLLHASQRLWQYFDIAFRYNHLRSPELIGRNSAFTSGIYAAVGGYNEQAILAEDLEIGWLIKNARNYDSNRVRYVNSASLVSNPRRAVSQLVSGGHLIQQYGDFHTNESVRRAPLEELLTKKTDFKPEEFGSEVQSIYDHYSRWRKSQNGWIDDADFDKSFSKAMGLLGVKYHTEGNSVILDDISKLSENLEKLKAPVLNPPPEVAPSTPEVDDSDVSQMHEVVVADNPPPEPVAVQQTPEPATPAEPPPATETLASAIAAPAVALETPKGAPEPTVEDVVTSWTQRQPKGFREAMMENIEDAAQKDKEFAMFVGFTKGADGTLQLDEDSRIKFAAYRVLARDLGYDIGEPVFNESAGTIQAPIAKMPSVENQKPAVARAPTLFSRIDAEAGSKNFTVNINPEEALSYMPSLVKELAPTLEVPADEMSVVPTHRADRWEIAAKTKDPNQSILLTLSPDQTDGFSVKLKLKGFGMRDLLAGMVNAEAVMSVLNGNLEATHVSRLTLAPDGTMVLTGTSK